MSHAAAALVSQRPLPRVPDEIRNLVFITQSGEVLIASGRENDTRVRGFLTRARLLMAKVETRIVAYTDLQEIIAESSVDTTTAVARDSDKIRLALEIQQRGARLRASDVHIRVYSRKNTSVLFRIDGELREMPQFQMSAADGEDLCRVIYQSMTNTADKTYVPTRGQKAQIADESYLAKGLSAVRVQTSPHKLGQLMVLRLLYTRANAAKGSLRERLTAAGYGPLHIEMYRAMVAKPTGLILIAGETGSGKSTTLMHLLESLHQERPGAHVLTIEDPPEYDIEGAMQIPVVARDDQEHRNDAFTRVIMDTLRMDPNIIMIGEVRDAASAELAMQAANTGHLAFSTVHTNSCIDTLLRLHTLLRRAVDPVMYMSNPKTLGGLCYQTLVPLLCEHCRQPLKGDNEKRLPEDVYGRLKHAGLLDFDVHVRGPGCSHCQTERSTITGVYERTVVAETVCTDAKYLEHFNKLNLPAALDYWINEMNGRPVMAHALEKVARGLVDPVLMEYRVGWLEAMPADLWAPQAQPEGRAAHGSSH